MINVEKVGVLPNGLEKVKFTDGPFSDIIITLGKVSFTEEDGGMTMHYEYDVVEHKTDFVKEELDRHVGDFLMQLLDEGLKNNDITYTGGTDED